MKCLPYKGRIYKEKNGDYSWCQDGSLVTFHSFNDQASYKSSYGGYSFWHKGGIRHRDYNKPAHICNNGVQGWYIKGKLVKEKFSDGTIRIYNQGS